MRPLKITISAFCSYAQKTEINFEKLGAHGIYLITGDTGAGKTTIFDAIKFALYGNASGNLRDTKTLRSKYAAPDAETFVELVFEYANKIYTVRRSPEYMRPPLKGKKEKLVKHQPEQSLLCPDGSCYCDKKEVSAKISDIMGIDSNQFSQIAMIAQGDFLKLLNAPTDERIKIFQKLFNTQNYAKLQDALAKEFNDIKQTYDKQTEKLKDITLIKNILNAPQYANIKEDDFNAINDILTNQKYQETQLLSELTSKIQICEEQIIRLNKNIDIGKRYQTESDALKKNIEEKKLFEEKLQIQKEQYRQQKNFDGEISTLDTKIANIESQRPKFKQLRQYNIQTKQLRQDIENLKTSIGNKQSEADQLLKNTDALKRERLSIAPIIQQHADFSIKAQKIEQQKSQLLSLQNLLHSLIDRQKEYFNAKNYHDDCFHRCKNLLSDKNLENSEARTCQSIKKDIETAVSKLDTQIANIHAQEPKFNRLSEYHAQKIQIEQKINSIQSSLKIKRACSDDLLQEINALKNERLSLEPISQTITKLQLDIQTEKQKQTVLVSLKEKLLRLNETWKCFQDEQLQYQNSAAIYQQAQDHFQKLHDLYFNDLAGILSECLQPDMPCPVCGSVSHPEPAQKSPNAPEKKDVTHAENEARHAQKLKENASMAAHAAHGRFVQTCQSVTTAIQEYTQIFSLPQHLVSQLATADANTMPVAAKSLLPILKDQYDAVCAKIQNLATALTDAQKKEERKIQIDSQLPNKDFKKEKLLKEIATQNESLSAENQKLINVHEQIQDLQSQLEYQSKEELATALGQNLNKKQSLQTASDVFENADKEINAASGRFLDARSWFAQEMEKQAENLDIPQNFILISQSDATAATYHTERLNQILQFFQTQYAKYQETSQIIKHELDNIQKKEERKIQIDNLLPEYENINNRIQHEIAQSRETLCANQQKLKNLEDTVHDIQSDLKFKSESELENAIQACREKKEDIRQATDMALAALNQTQSQMDTILGQIQTHRANLQSLSSIDIESENEKLQTIQQTKIDLGEEKKYADIRYSELEKAIETLKKGMKNIESLSEKYQNISRLADTAGGRLSGHDKMTLETYIQATCFERIIARANIHLMEMTSGRFELKRNEKPADQKSKTGLDLDVVDHYNGSERTVKSLSGGESFKAALSLALGLSNEIQENAGGIQLNAMFIDEGFGTLDNESLNSAINTLAALSNNACLIGIISHVEQLKERIDRKIIVSKDQTGCSRIQITT